MRFSLSVCWISMCTSRFKEGVTAKICLRKCSKLKGLSQKNLHMIGLHLNLEASSLNTINLRIMSPKTITTLCLMTIFLILVPLLLWWTRAQMIYRSKWGETWLIKGKRLMLKTLTPECKPHFKLSRHLQSWCISNQYLSNFTQWWISQQQLL
jgi:hypothetical protein